MQVITEFVNPPIPDRSCDWVAYSIDLEGTPQGYGRTKEEALRDFYDKLDDVLTMT